MSENLILLINKLPKTSANLVIFHQTIRSGTSIGANYHEACEAESAKDFVHKIRISKKEAKETCYWLVLLLKTNPKFKKELEGLSDEVSEFIKIFSKISSKFK
ncbi:MAG: four helix bundle protein [Candidatus Woesebacteria bacterium]|nr:four helix bundle protein [Candidatus Woesebacteria bacterium]